MNLTDYKIDDRLAYLAHRINFYLEDKETSKKIGVPPVNQEIMLNNIFAYMRILLLSADQILNEAKKVS